MSKEVKLAGVPATLEKKGQGFTTEQKITEENLREIARLQLSSNLSPWLTTEQAWEELAAKAVYDRAKSGKKAHLKS